AEALNLYPDSRVLVPGCGTGLDFEFLAPAVAGGGSVMGIDLSRGMLQKAKRRVERRGWSNVTLKEEDAGTLDVAEIPKFDRLLFFLTLSVLPDWEKIFRSAWGRLEEGGRCVIFDVYANRRVPQSWLVERVARADLSRPVWEPLMEVASGDSKSEIIPGSPHIHGGHLYLSVGAKN
ncbi:class I SAM-dependent methyltransferase, partial [Myxococcota bacterium]|nr:class I SAM-dependent methyltransferase [Myxococcota bacterium]